jgi:hypothetical protein
MMFPLALLLAHHVLHQGARWPCALWQVARCRLTWPLLDFAEAIVPAGCSCHAFSISLCLTSVMHQPSTGHAAVAMTTLAPVHAPTTSWPCCAVCRPLGCSCRTQKPSRAPGRYAATGASTSRRRWRPAPRAACTSWTSTRTPSSGRAGWLQWRPACPASTAPRWGALCGTCRSTNGAGYKRPVLGRVEVSCKRQHSNAPVPAPEPHLRLAAAAATQSCQQQHWQWWHRLLRLQLHECCAKLVQVPRVQSLGWPVSEAVSRSEVGQPVFLSATQISASPVSSVALPGYSSSCCHQQWQRKRTTRPYCSPARQLPRRCTAAPVFLMTSPPKRSAC